MHGHLHPTERVRDSIHSFNRVDQDQVESGWFPKEQAGHYDLNLNWWLKLLLD